MRYILAFIFSVSAFFAQAQQVNPVTDYTFANRMSSGRSTVTDTAAYFSIGPRYGAVRGMMPPMVTDTVAMSANKRNGLLIFSIQKNKYQVWDSAGAKWADITGAAGSAIISADTAAMLLPYLRKADTTAMLNPYLRGSGTANYLPIFDATRSVINSKVYQSGNHLMFNTTTPSVSAAEYGTMDVNGSENAAYILKVGDAEKSYILSNGTDLTISNNPAGDLIFRNNNATRGRFTSSGQFRVNNLASASTRLVTADTDGNLAGTVSITQFIDTTEISTRAWVQRGDDSLGVVIATKVSISDTATMLSPYLRKADTTVMLSPYARTSNVNASLALKLNISDTATMLSPYLKESDTTFLSNRINLKVNISDTSSMLTNYIRHPGNGLTKSGQALSVDTASIATRARVQKGIDSVGTLASAGVTSVATGYGLSGGTITTTGTIIVDSAIVASRLRVGKVVDSLALVKQNVLTNPVTGTGTTNYVPKFTGTSTIGNSTIFDDGEVKINTTTDAGDYKLQVSGNAYVTGTTVLAATSGNVGVGTASPTTKLHLAESNSGAFASVVLLSNTANTANDRTGIFGSPAVGNSLPYRGGIVFNPGASGYVSIHTGNNANPSDGERIRISGTTGNVLVNTATDAGNYKLQVAGDVLFSTTSGFNSFITHPLSGGGIAMVSTSNPSAAADRLFSLGFGSTTYPAQVRVEAYATEAWTSTNRGSYLSFSTTNTTTNTRTEKIRVNDNGGIRFIGQSAAPTAEAGTVYYDTDDNKLKVYNGTTWVDLH